MRETKGMGRDGGNEWNRGKRLLIGFFYKQI